MKTVIGLMDNYTQAEDLVKDLTNNGFRRDAINVVRSEEKAAAGAKAGAKKEGGFFEHIKELFTGVSGAPEEERGYYAEGVRRGGILVSVVCDDEKADLAADIMNKHGAIDIQKRAEQWKKAGWTRFDEKAAPYTPEQAS
ncbi:MAG TPA: hypothetical protein VF790_00075, partial [Dissulfurispiraceae bacterium]